MAEKKTRLDTYRVDMICEECGKGTMLPTGTAIDTTGVMEYQHLCDFCGAVESFLTTYPTYRQEEVDAGQSIKRVG